ncbi:MAG: flagellar M-ring protein FliF [Rickettsiales bacterium]|nr:flagellar M-ring protein FliF [Rickettsiales bacterium]
MVQSLKELSQVKLAAMIGTAVVLIGFFIFLSLRISSPVMAPLYTNVPVEDGSSIVAELDSRGIPYELRANGTQILVPSDEVNRLRLAMAEIGLPSSGSVVGYEIFDSQDSLGTSNFVLNVNKLRALEGELSRTISSFSQVDSARVHLVIPKRELFTRDRSEPTASVALKLRGVSELGKEEVASIRHLIATAVPGLRPQSITIVDSRGRLLARGGDEETAGVYAEEAEEFRVNYERRIRTTVERLLEQTLGYGKVKAEVNAAIDFDRITRNEEKFDPESQVARSIQGIEELERTNERNVDENVTVGNQLPDAQADNAGTIASSELSRTEETTNFEISKEVIQHVKETGTVQRLSVAVLVDGTYTTNEDGEQVYQPRSEEELEMLEDLVRSAIGYDVERGDEVRVVNMQFAASQDPFAEDTTLAWLKDDLDTIIQTLVLGGVAVLAILLVVRPLVARAIESAELAQQEEEMEQAALEGTTGLARLTDGSEDDAGEEDMINIDRIQGKVKSSSYRKINDLIDKHPDETLQIIRSWAFADLQ